MWIVLIKYKNKSSRPQVSKQLLFFSDGIRFKPRYMCMYCLDGSK